MSVGKESIRRAANAGAKKTVKIKRETAVKTSAKQSVVSPQNVEELKSAFEKPVHINEELPVYLL